MVGLKNARSAQDERLVECIFSSHQSPDTAYAPSSNPLIPPQPSPSKPVYGATSTNLIIDARPAANAMANVAMGAGTENMESYKTGKKAYLGIDNIHVMRNSLKTIAEAIREAEDLPGGSIDRGLLRTSNWLRHISALLDGALVIVKNIHLNASHVLVHCSDGWDRTSQLSATAQVCLDPYYRTLEGFKVLVEKDWLAFGYKFLDRSGHLSSEKLFTVAGVPADDSDDEGGGGGGAQKAAQAFLAWGQKQFASNSHLKEISPVFHQFLDCVRQIQRQFPDRFEFNEDFLLDLHYHLHACQFGTFLFNCERDRRIPSGMGKAYIDRTVSVWDWFHRPAEREKYLNPSFDEKLDDRDSRAPGADQGVLMFDPRNVRFWHRLFRRGDEEMNGSKLALAQAISAEVVTVTAGQVDLISVEGAVDNVATKLKVENGLSVSSPARSRRPSPTPETKSLPDSLDDVRNDPSSASPPDGSESSSPVTRMNQGPPLSSKSGNWESGRGSGWNWSKVSSGAFQAIQGAAREIKSIGTEAINQIRTEAGEVQDEIWSRGESNGDAGAPGTEIGEGKDARGGFRQKGKGSIADGRLPRTIGRISSEAKPSGSSDPASTVSPPFTTLPPQAAKREPSWNTNPWGDPSSAGPVSGPAAPEGRGPRPRVLPPGGMTRSLADLKLENALRPNGTQTLVGQQEAVDKKAMEDALGGDRKAWDPLGAV